MTHETTRAAIVSRQPFDLHCGLQCGPGVEQSVEKNGQRCRAAAPADPAEQQSDEKYLSYSEPVILYVHPGPGSRDCQGRGQYRPWRTSPAAVKKAAKKNFFAGRCHDHESETEQQQATLFAGRVIGIDLEGRDNVAAKDHGQSIE